MRDCIFLVADKNMEGMLKGFLTREAFHLSLGCRAFDFDSRQDLLVAHGQNDPGLYTRASEFLQPYAKSHSHAVVMVDADWDGSPGREAISQRLEDHLTSAGWANGRGCGVVIDPELENWIWQDNPRICSALGFIGTFADLRTKLENNGFWRPMAPKPHRPKEAVEWVFRQTQKRRSSAIYQQLAMQVSLKGCTDGAFQSLRNALVRWFS